MVEITLPRYENVTEYYGPVNAKEAGKALTEALDKMVDTDTLKALAERMNTTMDIAKDKSLSLGMSLADSMEYIRQLAEATPTRKVHLTEFKRGGKLILHKPGESTRNIKHCRDKEIVIVFKGSIVKKYIEAMRILIPVDSISYIIYDDKFYTRRTKGNTLEIRRGNNE